MHTIIQYKVTPSKKRTNKQPLKPCIQASQKYQVTPSKGCVTVEHEKSNFRPSKDGSSILPPCLRAAERVQLVAIEPWMDLQWKCGGGMGLGEVRLKGIRPLYVLNEHPSPERKSDQKKIHDLDGFG